MSFESFIIRIMSGESRGVFAAATRAALACAEPFYRLAVNARNRRFDRNPARSARLPCPVISIGNITTGGTGKTPLVRWLAGRVRDAGRRVAVLARGYKSRPGELGDEQRMMDRMLNAPGTRSVEILAHPDRLQAASVLFATGASVDVIVLDDGFQHRRVARDLDIVLLNATEPFGFGRVLPRGLLREPLKGLRRAGAIVLTHVNAVEEERLNSIEQEVRRHNASVPLYRCSHVPAGLRSAATPAHQPPDRTVESLAAERVFAVSGIGNPQAFERELRPRCAAIVGHAAFADHHKYGTLDIDRIRESARDSGATSIVTTEKDWVKLAELEGVTTGDPPFLRLDVSLQFEGDDEERLFAAAMKVAAPFTATHSTA